MKLAAGRVRRETMSGSRMKRNKRTCIQQVGRGVWFFVRIGLEASWQPKGATRIPSQLIAY